MAIPITCPGCQAAFEVPDTLAGKTIRCTSCKTQLTVAATDAKKPFGWASSSSTPAVAKAAVPAANGAAKAALVRPTAKAMAAVVDDDEDEKTSPNRPATKAGSRITGAPKKRRDDDDDDDDQPRRKKKNAGGGSGAMIALIAGGVICLAAVVGLSVWLLSGDDKKDSAKSDSNNTNSTPPAGGRSDEGGRQAQGNDDGGRPSGGDGGFSPNKPGRPGGGRPNGGAAGGDIAGWQTLTVEGLTCQMPGSPRQMSQVIPGAGTMAIHVLEDRTKNTAFVVMNMTLPPQAANVPPANFLNAMVQGAEQNAGGFSGGFGAGNVGVGGKSDITQDGFPGKDLQLINKTTRAGVGSLRVVLAGIKVYMFGAFGENFSSFQSEAAQFMASVKITGTAGGGGGVAAGGGPGGAPGVGAGDEAGFGEPPSSGGGPPGRPPGAGGFPTPPMGGGGGVPGGPPGGFPTPPIGGGGPPSGIGIGVPGQPPGGGVPGRPPAGGPPRPPGVGGDGGGAGIGAPGQPPGGGIPGRPPIGGPGGAVAGPPGAGGGFGQPPDSNPPPFGVNTNGKKKATIPQFFTGVFDSDKKEFITFSTSPEKGKSITKMNRYDAAKSFAGAGSYKVPHFVSRAVIDPTKGYLYAATINTPTRQNANEQYDQTAGIGDVAVFDLNAIRSGAIADGADLKPLGIFPVGGGKKIHGLEVTPDGKTLIVLTTTTTTNAKSTPKSYLTRYDTETRKPIDKPKELAEAAWDMRKSPDGKFLVIVDLATGAGKNANVRTFNMNETLSADRNLPLQGTANDAAMSPTGQFTGVVLGAAGTKVLFANAEETKDLDVGFGWKAAAKPGYVEYSPDGKLLFVSGHVGLSGKQSAGLDVYEVTDPNSPTGVKKKASILTAGDQAVGGHFFVSPEGEYLIFHTGVVVTANDIGGSNGEPAGGAAAGGGAAPGAGGGAPGAPAQPSGAQPPAAGGAPGMPPYGYGSGPPRPPPSGDGGSPMRPPGSTQPPPGGAGGAPAPMRPPGGTPPGAPTGAPGGAPGAPPGAGGGNLPMTAPPAGGAPPAGQPGSATPPKPPPIID